MRWGVTYLVVIIYFSIITSCEPVLEREPEKKLSEPSTPIKSPEGLYEGVHSAELSIEKLRPESKTIEWRDISTREHTTFMSSSIEVDKIFRSDTDDLYGVRVRLRNLTGQHMHCEFKINFYDEKGNKLISVANDWTKVFVEAHDYETIYDYCKVKGAIGFILHLKKSGTNADGMQDGIVETKEGTTYMSKVVYVSKVMFKDADDKHTVDVKLRNTTRDELNCEYKISFYSNLGEMVKEADKWERIVIKPLDTGVVSGTCERSDAIGFKLYVRKSGEPAEGTPDLVTDDKH